MYMVLGMRLYPLNSSHLFHRENRIKSMAQILRDLHSRYVQVKLMCCYCVIDLCIRPVRLYFYVLFCCKDNFVIHCYRSFLV